ncbi:hypothetical protein JHK82_044657 [Glycine max]|nr:hypothetical protein JHK82_044657 [Glycine max]
MAHRFCIFETGEKPRNQTLSRIAICLHNDNTVLATIMVDVMVMKEIEDMALRLGVDLSTLNLDVIRVAPGEDCSIVVYQEENLEFESRFGNIIVVDNLLVVPREKFEKLEGVVQKIYSQIGVIKEDGLWMPVDPETEKTLCYYFIEYNTPQEAELAKEKTHGYKLDRAHIFVVSMFDDFDRFMKVPNEWAPPETKPYAPGSANVMGMQHVLFKLDCKTVEDVYELW